MRQVAATLALAALAAGTPGVQAQTPELRPPVSSESSPDGRQFVTNVQPPDATYSKDQDLAAQAEALPKPSLDEALERPGSLLLRNTPMDAALLAISQEWKVNIVTGKAIEGTVNCAFEKAPLREVLDSILLANGYSYRAVGDSLVVQPTADVGSANPLFRSTTIPIQYGNLEEIVAGVELLKSAGGQVKSFPQARSLMVLDYAERVEAISAFVTKMEAAAAEAVGAAASLASTRLDVAYFHTHFIPASAAQQPLLAVLSPLGRVAIMQRENRLLVVDYAANLDMVRKVLDRIDRPRPQVRITALIYDISLQDAEQLGVNWGSAGKGNTVNADGEANQALQFETTTLAPFATGEAGGTLTVRSLTRNFDINTIVQLLQTANDARLLANPNVTVMDNELAEWKSIQEIPYQQITQSELGGQIGTTSFKEAGITLRVQPTIAGDGTIEMLIEPEFSRLAGFTPNEDQPILDTRKAMTRVRIANRQTLVLSGLRQRSDTGEFNGIPFLKDIKYIGPIFRSRNTTVRESELIVFIMPEIICYDEPPGCREFQALETIDCRLEHIPYAEGCGPMAGVDGCAIGEVVPLPPVDEIQETVPQDLPPAEEPMSSLKTNSPMRPSSEALFRADGSTGLRLKTPEASEPKADSEKAKPSIWKRMFRS
jgi:general secretion pathway protein D